MQVRKNYSFTLLELTVVVVIVGVLVTLGLPPYMMSIEKAKNRAAWFTLNSAVDTTKEAQLKLGGAYYFNGASWGPNPGVYIQTFLRAIEVIGASDATSGGCGPNPWYALTPDWCYWSAVSVLSPNPTDPSGANIFCAERNMPNADPRYRVMCMTMRKTSTCGSTMASTPPASVYCD